ncbi:NAD-dependent epimerase/dehydratase family protein [Desulfurococcaceae archaeon MEX13E-LK6-19]|nr:NAD-dependent epimerase/dehydratase family protein [Desulfurococcaceae archaeon MEX13E-LK6-19]
MTDVSGVLNRVIVTGGAGFIGSHLVDELSRRGAEKIIVVDNLSNGRLDNLSRHMGKGYFSFVKADLKDPNGQWVDSFKDADVVFHFAANPEVRVSSVDPRSHFNENIYATFNVLEAARKHDVKYHVFASSSTVYGEAKIIPTPEDYHPLEPISVYGATKLACEALYISYAKLYGFKVLIARYANIIGPRSNHGVIIDFINKLKKNPKRLEILGDGTQKKSYLHVYDAVDATLHAFNYLVKESNNDYEVFNIGSSDWIQVIKIADIIVEEMGLKNVEYVFVKTTPDGRGWPGDVKLMLLDISKLKSIGWSPRWNSYEAVRKTVRELLGKE